MSERNIRVLIVDDDEDDYFITRSALTEIEDWNVVTDWADKYDDARRAIVSGGYDVCLVDYRLGAKTGLDLIKAAAAQGCRTPLILLTGQGDRSVDIEAMECGAADYLAKGNISSLILERSIRYCVQRRRSEESKTTLESQLNQLQKMESVGRLAGGIAHEFNNLLTPIIGFTQISLAQPTGTDLISNLQQVDRAASRASQLVKQLLTFSRPTVAAPKVINLDHLITDTGKMLRQLIGEDIELVLLLGSDANPIKADPSQMEQVLVNLTVNARDAILAGGKITIETAAVPAESQPGDEFVDECVMLAVSDNGCGMTDEVKGKIFEPFFTTKEQGKGTGLGLATCYGIVDQLGGRIDVESEVGKGTTFRVYLPAHNLNVLSADSEGSDDGMPRGIETVLLVEDEPLVRSLAATILKEQGYTVLEATNGQEALRVAGQYVGNDIGLLLTDVVMPQMGGLELSNKFSSLYPKTRVLLMSGYNEEITGDEAFGFIAKPFTPPGLTQKIREVFADVAA